MVEPKVCSGWTLVETNIMQQKFGPVDFEHISTARITVGPAIMRAQPEKRDIKYY